MRFSVECFPAFNYARDEHEIHLNESGAAFHSPNLSLQLSTTVPLQKTGQGLTAQFTLNEGQTATFAIGEIRSQPTDFHPFSEEESEHLFEDTVAYWRRWLSKSTYKGRWREMVERSALTLKLLTFEPTGAIVAAPTCRGSATPGFFRVARGEA